MNSGTEAGAYNPSQRNTYRSSDTPASNLPPRPNRGYEQPSRPNRGYEQPSRPNRGYEQPPRLNRGYEQPPRLNRGYEQPPRLNRGYEQPPRLNRGYEQPPMNLPSSRPPRDHPTRRRIPAPHPHVVDHGVALRNGGLRNPLDAVRPPPLLVTPTVPATLRRLAYIIRTQRETSRL
ncbi:PREDICTED: extensin-3-like [Branchiostoma belcheri]|uniref:Extensin-3-like n=1 Tax=Branchiostoma belcheri TaxID=7741 RepID=A0A6P4YBR1_BRABE|nr:PREDICTED: extensin-3-like [Branchiostoma belcheri]